MGIAQFLGGLDAEEDFVCGTILRPQVANVIGGDGGDANMVGQRDDAADLLQLAGESLVLNFEIETVAEHAEIPVGGVGGFVESTALDESTDLALRFAG